MIGFGVTLVCDLRHEISVQQSALNCSVVAVVQD
jgi:hypothetical protein